MKSNVAIVYIDVTKFGEHWSLDHFDSAWDVGKNVLEKSGYHRAGVGSFNFAGGISEYEKAKLKQMLRVPDKEIRFFEGGRESGITALEYAVRSIKSGECDVAFVGSSERSLNTGSNNNGENLLRKGDEFYIEAGKMKMQFMHDINVSEASLAGIPVKAHFQGYFNPKAQYQNFIKKASVLRSPFVEGAKPLRDLEKSFENSCGAVGMILCNEDEARKHPKPVFIEGFGTSYGVDKEHSYIIPSIETTIEKACKNVVNPKEISLLQIPDNATPLEAIALSNVRIPRNEIEEVLKNTFKNADEPEKQTPSWPYALDKPLFVNTDGGDKVAGLPGYPTSYLRKVVETFLQLRGEADKRQVPNVKHGLVLSIDDYREMSTSAHLLGVR